MILVLGVLLSFLSVYLTFQLVTFLQKKNVVREAISAKRKAVAEDFSKLEARLLTDGKLLTKERESIVGMTVSSLVDDLRSRRLTCVEVLQAYQAKALEVTKELNCVTEFIKEAEEWARELDKSDIKGPLHGVPFSVKDNIAITGYDCTLGVSKFLNQPHESDAALVEALKQLGAIPFCKTNIPQTLLSFGCGNPVFGTTRNPHHKERTPGGSSGGEGCIVAAGASPFGLGSDIGGSLRSPAAFCGVSSLKPTADRLSYRGYQKSVQGCVGVDAVAGVIARDIETLILVNRLLLENSHIAKFDHKLPPIPWRETMFLVNRKLRIGYYEDDGFFPTTAGVRRSIQIARQSLENLGHQLVPFQPPQVERAVASFIRVVQGDGGRYLRKLCEGQSIDSSFRVLYASLCTPNFLKPVVKPILGALSPRLQPLFLATRGYGMDRTHQLWEELLFQSELRNSFINDWKKLELDLCICPVFPCPAPLIKDIGRLTPSGSYTMYYNYVNLPAGIVPITKETQQDQLKLGDYNYNDMLCRLVKKTTEGAEGMPIAIQVIGLPFQEELILRGMEILNSTLN